MNQNMQDKKFQFSEFPTLSSDALVLREITPADAASIMEISYYDGIQAGSEEEAAAMLEKINASYGKGESIHWGICFKDQNEIVGTCGFYRGFSNNIGEIGYVLKEAHRGKGIMTQAVRITVEFGLKEMKLAQVTAYTDKTNTGSINVLKRSGFREVASENEHLKFST